MNDLSKANQEALQSINAIISGQSIGLNNQQKSYLQHLISGIEMNTRISDLQGMRWAPVVQVKTTVSFAARPDPNEVKVKLDIDIPPENSKQQPHIGYEVKWNDKRVGNGHIWISPNVLHASRPGFQQKLEKYGFSSPWLDAEAQNPEYVKANVRHVKFMFKRWRGA
ncbi:uncharacterized protein N7500_008431 [Penicillium coprophilum]|uniref:uncharacterized protein n=1 Tax=Penicillium coprophilum TaxID=36646 RepID=UPI00239AA38B|nr:uncharacterized protein N7500_008431 [Penicillium coprophilum]KAJ5158780.1 hypothetical protein N7500_008431 [Penicillium coprophilum]